MPLQPVVSVGNRTVVLSLDVDVLGTVIGWQLQNNTTGPAVMTLTSGLFSASQEVLPGTHSGLVPLLDQWLYGADAGTFYGLTVRSP